MFRFKELCCFIFMDLQERRVFYHKVTRSCLIKISRLLVLSFGQSSGMFRVCKEIIMTKYWSGAITVAASSHLSSVS